ncbi:MAG TPA: UbiA family prenyltransferase, partial [Vicinamibacterales bacterium]|nr:UbiA family prenyltransferase [Vicinamibacterales bacterium]
MARPISPAHPVPGASPEGGAGSRSTALLLFHSLRPEQWTKNLIVFAGLIFGLELFDRTAVVRSMLAFAIFCALSGVVYIINDIMDREADRRHPLKARRPIASGALSPVLAGGAAAVLGVAALAAAFSLAVPLGVVALAYVLLQSAYSGPLKHIVILDVLAIAIGFV